jgi:hypothetical protein
MVDEKVEFHEKGTFTKPASQGVTLEQYLNRMGVRCRDILQHRTDGGHTAVKNSLLLNKSCGSLKILK